LLYIAKYRTKTVNRHLNQSFPSLSATDKKNLTKKIYRNLSDVSLESLKGYTMQESSLASRWRVTNPELINQYFNNNQSVIFVCGHLCNWEWGISLDNQIQHHCIKFYKPLHNKAINDYLKQCRSRSGNKPYSAKKAMRSFVKNKNKCCAFALIADQHPAGTKSFHWTRFLNQDTAVIMGPEVLAKKFNYPVIYCSIQKKRRGFYEATFSTLTATPQQTYTGEICELFMKSLEQDIQRQPETWLWTHKRWKMKPTQ